MSETPTTPDSPVNEPNEFVPVGLAGDAPADTAGIPAPEPAFQELNLPAEAPEPAETGAGSSEGAVEAAQGSASGQTPSGSAEQYLAEPPATAVVTESAALPTETFQAPPVQAPVPASVISPVEPVVPPAPEPDEPADDDEPDPSAEPETAVFNEVGTLPPESGRRFPRPFSIAFVVLAGLLAASVTLILLKSSSTDELNVRKAKAVTEAKSFAHDVTAYNYQSLDADFAKVLSHATGKFEKDFGEATKPNGQFVSLVKQYKATATSEVLEAGVISATKTHAFVLVIISQTVQNTNRPTATAQRNEGKVELVWKSGAWKVQDFTIL